MNEYRREILDLEKTHEKKTLELEKSYLEVVWSISFRIGRLITYPFRKPFVLLILPRLVRYPFLHSLVRLLRAGIANPIRLKNLLSVRRVKRFLELFIERGSTAESTFRRVENIFLNDNNYMATALENLQEAL